MERDTGTDINSAQLAEDYRAYPIDSHGKLRYAYGKITADGALAADGTMAFFWLPPGRKRILPSLSKITCTAFGAGRTLDVGHNEYVNELYAATRETEAADPDAFADGANVSAALDSEPLSNILKFDMYSKDQVLITGTVLGDTMPDGAEVELLLAYIYE